MTSLFVYKFVFMTELMFSEWLFVMRLKRKPAFQGKALIGVALCYLCTACFPILYYNAAWTSFMFLVLFLFTVAALKACLDESWQNIVFCAIAAYTVQHFAYGLDLIVVTVTGLDGGISIGMYSESVSSYTWPGSLIFLVIYIDCYALTYWVMYLVFASRIRKNESLCIRSGMLFVLAFLILAVDIVVNAALTYYSYDDYNRFYLIIGYLYNIICCLLVLSIQFGQLMQRQLMDELDVVHALWSQEKEQYERKKENIDLINLKCHDLKHQISEIGRTTDISRQVCREIEDLISIYDTNVETGNEILNVILTEKSLQCQQKHIELSCIADGSRLIFMDEIDLYTLFGNAVDNAMEAVMQVPEEMRIINLTIKMQQGGLAVCLYNYFQTELIFRQGLPVTTKSNQDYHGFGLKSIARIVDKYEGTLSITTDHNVFTLNIFFPHMEERAF